MKKTALIGILLISVFAGRLSAQDLGLPQPSPWAQVGQKFGMAKATITYSRPSMKGRKIFGGLVPYNEIWRTGANACTTIELEGNVMINNQKVDAGTYSLFTIPGEKEWTIILNKNTGLWGAGGYKQEEDVMRFTVKPTACPSTESFTIGFSNIKEKSVTVQLYWETTMVGFDITNDFVEEGKKSIDDAIAAAENTMSLYNDAAEFYLDNNLDAAKALEWAKASTAQKERYWNVYTLARAYAANNMKKEAVDTATKALALANEAKNNGFAQTISASLEDWKK